MNYCTKWSTVNIFITILVMDEQWLIYIPLDINLYTVLHALYEP